MLEKIAGVAVVTKLWAIMLMEVELNFHIKINLWGTNDGSHTPAQDGAGENIQQEGKHQVLAYNIAIKK